MMRILFAYAVMFLAACVYGEADTPTPKQGETIEAKSLAEIRINTNDPILTNKWYQLIAARAQKEGITMEEAARKVVAEHKQGKLQPIQQPQTTVPPRKKHWDKLLLVGVILGGVMVKQGKGLVRLFGCIISLMLGCYMIYSFCCGISETHSTADKWSEVQKKLR